MAPAKQLFDLQQLEQELRQLGHALQQVQVQLRDSGARDRAVALAGEAKKSHEASRAELRDVELATQTLTRRMDEVEQRLYGGRTTNAKELVSLQDDLRMLQRQKQEREAQTLSLMAKAEEAEAAAGSAASAAAEAERAWQTEQSRLRQEEARLSQRLTPHRDRVAAAGAALSARESVLYESLKKTRGGVAVGRVERGLCTACGVAQPSAHVQKARASDELVRCNSCGRVLYVG
ncbi:MAG: hypothetical protein FJ315_07755 [SAR202 cluster bacterium]|nr:hypothetical protein [SAR202 cluster bacterium]